ncbi:hypothetical protein [Leuconostoc mesenteroides]|uniref:hypothetical protein n=1 Tax=Leuconostoc mesenteroides TaxID=1245 RepID=UPI0023607BB0|nr:hypothetical protein [Leuconostoc mesenteroides]
MKFEKLCKFGIHIFVLLIVAVLFFGFVFVIWKTAKFLVPKITEHTIRRNIDSKKIIQNKALEKYSFWRAILLLGLSTVIAVMPVLEKLKKVQGHTEFFGRVVVVISVFIFIFSVYWFCIYESIARPLLEKGLINGENYRKTLNDYRARMNIVFTIFLLTSFIIGLNGFLFSIEKKSTIGLSWVTIPVFISGVVYLITTEKNLEDIYSVYFAEEYYQKDRIRLF